ncbi:MULTISPECIES: hypothetical protein [Wolbachia]|uniref:hypothetical protein n=1 Tax=Wolbachia TaxID=953 RepID=UPI001BA64179|nr:MULTISPECIES: hypothetical protein [unclassified Wolbachia]QUI60120.1 hypothetical protein JKF54_04195 [Wolbachia endosymbiont of Spodoptera picta]URG40198.1 hypothetical protein M1L25_000228 [Wolbachia endosymbiont of Ostrinia furnacalis]URG41090.1 hypothetical protein M1L26_000067 [Wolbachia endosymbiont of Ostrinia scapulalis]
MIVELKMPESSNSKNVKNKPQEQREGGSGGFIGLLKSITKALFNSVVDLPQQEQLNKNIDRQQGLDSKRKSPEDLNQEKKLEVKEAAEGLKEKLEKSDIGNQSIRIESPNQDNCSSKTMNR